MNQKLVKIPTMSCSYCSQLIRQTLGAIEGVQHVEVHLDEKEILVRWSEPATWDEIVRMLSEIEYPPQEEGRRRNKSLEGG